MRRPELLAPAGGPEAGYAALTYGADAVYLGLKRFSARAEAENFSLDELDGLTAWAHSLAPRRRVYVTLNTLVLEAELPELLATAAALRDLAVDAVIVQDLGAMSLFRRHFPTLELHASTQMAVHSRRGVEALAALGVRRVVAARELTLAEVRDLCGQTAVEVECFVHGAVCYAYSGLCLFSSLALGRSANRGRCAYVCGGSFTEEGPGPWRPSSLPFAMKDLALPNRLAELAAAGVVSLKIEGRKKSPLYVAAVTDLYRGLLDGTLTPEERRRKEDDLRTIFSRPWTELYLDSPRQNACGDAERVGHRGARVGAVASVRGNRRQGTVLRFRTSRALEVHDGLQIEIPGLVKPFGFSIEELRVPGSPGRLFEVPAGAEVEVTLPQGHPAIPVGAAVHCTSSQAVKRVFRWSEPREGEYRNRRPVDVELRVTPECVSLHAGVGPNVATCRHLEGTFEPARDPGAAAAGAQTAFERLGNTPFALGRLEVANDQGLFVAPSQWNRLRRGATDALEAALAEARQGEVRTALDSLRQETAARPPAEERWALKIDRIDLVEAFEPEDWEQVAELVVSLDGEDDQAKTLPALRGRERLRLSLPPVMRSWDEERLLPVVAGLRAAGWARWELANLAGWGHLGLAPGEPGSLDLTADWPLYALNSAAGNALLDLGLSAFTLSPEDGGENMQTLLGAFGARASVIVYQHPPLFLSETCPRATLAGECPAPGQCGSVVPDHGQGVRACPASPSDARLSNPDAAATAPVRQSDAAPGASSSPSRGPMASPGRARAPEPLSLVSDFGDRVRVLSRRCRTVVLSRSPLCLSEVVGELRAAGARSFRVDLQYADLSPSEARELWRRVRAGLPVPGTQPGNYRRGLR